MSPTPEMTFEDMLTSNKAQDFAGLNVYTACRQDALIGTISHEGGLANRSKN